MNEIETLFSKGMPLGPLQPGKVQTHHLRREPKPCDRYLSASPSENKGLTKMNMRFVHPACCSLRQGEDPAL